MKIKSYLLAIFFIILINCSYSQKCSISRDPITNEAIASFNYKERKVYFEHKKGILSLEMMFTYSGELNVVIPKGSELFYKLENGEIIKLITVNNAVPNSQIIANQNSATVLTFYSYIMQITKQDLNKLANSKVVLIRFPNGKDGQQDFILKGRWKKISGAILKGAVCMLSNS